MKRIIYLSFILAMLFLASAENSLACSCLVNDEPLEKQIQRAFAGSEVIFSGEVITVETKGENTLSIKIKTSQIWKGEKATEFTVSTASQSAMCGYYFEVGKKYLVYASTSNDVLMTTSCSRTAEFNESGDAKQLDKLTRTPTSAKPDSSKVPAGISEWVGEDSEKIVKNEMIGARLKKLLGKSDHRVFLGYFETSRPIEKSGNLIFASGCMIRSCTHLESAIAIDPGNNTIHAAIFDRVEGTKYFNEACAKTPESILNWENRLEDLNATEVQTNAVLIDEFHYENSEDLMVRIDSFTVRLSNHPTSKSYIVISGDKRSRNKVEKEIKQYIKRLGMDVNEFEFFKSEGDQKALIKLWLVPEGAEPPEPAN